MRPLRASQGFRIVLLVGLTAMEAVADEAVRSPSVFLPSSGLQFYLESDGLKAHERAWKDSAAHDILVKTPSGSTMADVERQMLDQIFKLAFSESKLTGAGFVALQDHLVSRGFAFAIYGEEGESSTAFVLNGLGDEGGIGRFESILRGMLRIGADAPLPTPTRLRNRELRGFGVWNAADALAQPAEPVIPNILGGPGANGPPTALTWWREGDALIVVNGPRLGVMDSILRTDRANKDFPALHRGRVSAVLDAIEAKRPIAATHPAYLASKVEGRDLPGFEPSGLFFAQGKDGQGVLQALRAGMPGNGGIDEFAFFETMDLNRAERIVGRWGFRGKSLVTDVRFSFSDAWNGPFRQPGFARDRLPPIPTASGIFAVGSLDQARTVERFAPLEAALIPEAKAFLDAFNQAIREASTPKLREDVLRHLGPTWSIYAAPGVEDDPKRSVLPVFLVEFHDAEGLEKALGALVSGINGYFRAKLEDPADAKQPAIAFERLPEPERGYRLVSPKGLIPWLTDKMQPTIVIGRSYLALAVSPAQARAALAAESNPGVRWAPGGELARSLECLPANLVFLSAGNPRDSGWPEALATFRESAPNFLGKFLHLDQLGGPAPNPQPDLLEVLGVPKDARARTPKADELRALIHPSLVAATVEDRSFRVIALEALPFGCIGFETQWSPRGDMSNQIKFGPGR